MRILKSHSAENVKGITFGIFNIHSVAEYQKKMTGAIRKHLKILEKSLTVPKKLKWAIF